jgi:hypothetical protein
MDSRAMAPAAKRSRPRSLPSFTTESCASSGETAPRPSARTFLQGKLIQKSTGERTLPAATKIATDWHLDLRDRTRRGEHLHGRAFSASGEAFLEHADHKLREVSEGQHRNHRQKWALLKAHFDGVKVNDVDTRFLLNLREKRAGAMSKKGLPIEPVTLKKDTPARRH